MIHQAISEDLARQNARHNREHQAEWAKWVREHNIPLLDVHSFRGFHKGQKVIYTNPQGVSFKGHTVMGFQEPDEYGRCIYLDLDCYWMAQPSKSLKPE